MKEEKSKDTRRRRRKKSIANLKLVLSLRLTATLIFESTRARKKQVSNFLESSLQKKERKKERERNFSKCQTWNSYPRGRTGFERDWREEEEEGSRINHRVSVEMFALFPVEGEKNREKFGRERIIYVNARKSKEEENLFESVFPTFLWMDESLRNGIERAISLGRTTFLFFF